MSWGPIRGHDRIVDSVRAALREGRFPHAWLFVGPHGIGKHAFATRLAQALLCEQNDPRDLNPCGYCLGCLQVDSRTHPDLYLVARPEDRHELPIASIRQLIADLGLKPSRGERKVAIIDDADDLNEEASNALLKTLEEPPPGSALFLIGSAAELQLDTIVSRCRVMIFNPLATDELAALLQERGIASDPATAALLAARAGGSLSLAKGLADPAFDTFRRDCLATLARPETLDPSALSRSLESFIKDAGKESIDQRIRARLLFGELARFFRSLLWQVAGAEPPSTDAEDLEAIAALAPRLEPEDVFALADRCLQAEYHLARKVYLPILLDAFTRDLARSLRGG